MKYDESSMPVLLNGWFGEFGGTCDDVGKPSIWKFSYIIRGTPNHDLVMDGHDLV
jgi:hypothetical protein